MSTEPTWAAFCGSVEAALREARIWEDLIRSQDGRCAECGSGITLETAAKRARSFAILCRACFEKGSAPLAVSDDITPEAP